MSVKKLLALSAAKVSQLCCDEQGAETIEAAMMIGFVVILSIAAVAAFGDTLAQRWNDIVNGM